MKQRLQSLDIVKGVVMVLMCIDHARDYTPFHPTDPMTLDGDMPFSVYFFRILAHLCAPAFILMAGVSARLVGERRNKADLSKYLLQRGAILCILEFTLVNWAWSFNPLYHLTYLQIIWAIGLSMIALAALIHLRRATILTIALVILFGHNLLSDLEFAQGSLGYYAYGFLLHKEVMPIAGEFMVRSTYPILPVIAIMALGYLIGEWYTSRDSQQRQRNMWRVGLSMLGLFVVTRLIVGYGDPHPIESGHGIVHYIMSAINTTKYPLSLNFVLLYLSISIMALAALDRVQLPERNLFVTLGRTPMFFYITHLYLLHTITLCYLAICGVQLDFTRFLGGVPPTEGFPMWGMLLLVTSVVAMLYPLCLKYYNLKRNHKLWITKYI